MADASANYRFGPFLLDMARRELLCDGEEVVVQARVFDLLAYLAANRERVIEKDELLEAVWPGRVITEAAMTRALMKARKAVGDDATNPSVIKTVHGKGYRFVAEIEVAAPASAPAVNASPQSRRMLSVAAVFLLLLTAVLLATRWPDPTASGETRIAVLPVHDTTGLTELGWSRLGLMSYASGLIAADGKLPVVADSGVIRISDNFAWAGVVNDDVGSEVIAKVRSMYGASHILMMQLHSEGNLLRLKYLLLGPDKAAAEGSFVGDDGTVMIQDVVQAVYKSMFRGMRLGDQFPVVSQDSFNNEAFARGKSLSLEGRCAEAVQFFKVVIEHEPELFEPRHQYVQCLRKLGETEAAYDAITSLIAAQREARATRPLGRTLMTLGVLHNRTGNLDEAEVALNEALEIAVSLDDNDLAARTLQNLAIVAEDRSDWATAEDRLGRALFNFRESSREVIPGTMYGSLANLAMETGDYAEAESWLEQALLAFRAAGDRRNEAMMLNNTGYLRRQQGRLDEALDYHRRSMVVRQEIGDRIGVGRIYGMMSTAYLLKGQFDEAVTTARSAIEIARQTGDKLFEATSLAQLGDTEKALGNRDVARQHYEAAYEVFAGIGDRMRSQQVLLKFAGLDLVSGDLDSAETAAQRVLEESRQHDLMAPEVRALELLGDVAKARGDLEATIDWYLEALNRVRETSWDSRRIWLMNRLANAYLDLADLESAEPLVGYLVLGEPQARSLLTQARFAYAKEDWSAAVEFAEQAKLLAGAGWEETDEAVLRNYRASGSSAPE